MNLDRTLIAAAMRQGELCLFDEVDSTNEYLLAHCGTLSAGALCIADSQAAGRGRRGRQWYSPDSQNLYFSMLWKYPAQIMDHLPALSLVVAVVVAESLIELGAEHIQIKWPNDIYHRGKKMGGILIENRLQADQVSVVIGIGLNLGMQQADNSVVNQPWANLADYQLNRSQLSAKMAEKLQFALRHYHENGLSPYLQRWQELDCFFNRPVKLLTDQGDFRGIARGIDENGQLLLQQGERLSPFAIGEISLRAD